MTVRAAAKDVPVDLAAIGNVEAFATVSVRAQVTGQLQEILFREGDFVKESQKLFVIDRRPFEAALVQAEANLTRDKALLAQAEAQLTRDGANAEYQQIASERQNQLANKGILSRDAADQARSQADATLALVKADKANVESGKAQVAAQEAAVENARVQLGYCIIYAPFDGRTGNLNVKVGSLVTANQLEMTTIAQIEPVLVTFSVPAVHLPTIKGRMAAERLSVTAVPQDADARPTTGSLTFVDNAVDTSTDSIKLKAAFENPDHRLWPGQFARVSLRLAMVKDAVVVPTQAVQTGQDGQYVFVVKDDSTVEQRAVKTGQRADLDTVIAEGLKPGETVVTEGHLRLESGIRVTTDTGGGERGRGGRGAPGRGGPEGGAPAGGQDRGGQGGAPDRGGQGRSSQ